MKKILIIITTAFVSYGGLAMVAMNYYRVTDKNKFKNLCVGSESSITKELKHFKIQSLFLILTL